MNGKYGIICGPMAVLLTHGRAHLSVASTKFISRGNVTDENVRYVTFICGGKFVVNSACVLCKLFRHTHTHADDARKPVNLGRRQGGFAWETQLRND